MGKGSDVANTMLLATVLFFASGSGKFEQPRVHMAAFGYAAAVLAFAIARTAMLPDDVRIRHAGVTGTERRRRAEPGLSIIRKKTSRGLLRSKITQSVVF